MKAFNFPFFWGALKGPSFRGKLNLLLVSGSVTVKRIEKKTAQMEDSNLSSGNSCPKVSQGRFFFAIPLEFRSRYMCIYIYVSFNIYIYIHIYLDLPSM